MSLTLETKVSEYFRITPAQKIALKKLGIDNIEDLLYHFPVRYGDTAVAKSIDSLQAGDSAVIFGKISGLKASKGFKTKVTMADGYVEDETGRIHCVWFNQPYLAKMIQDESLVRIEGKVSARRKKSSALDQNDKSPEIYFSNPKVEVVNNVPIGVGDSLFGDGNEAHTLYPVYPESRGISSSWIYHALQKLFKNNILEMIDDPIPESILAKYHLPNIKTALVWIHTPLRRDDAVSARKRFSFEEIFVIQLGKKQARKKYESHPSFLIETPIEEVQEFVRRFPFQATEAQTRAIETIVSEMKGGHAMSRLLEGDVGSGKTAVAAATAYAVMVSRPNKNVAPTNSAQNLNQKENLPENSNGIDSALADWKAFKSLSEATTTLAVNDSGLEFNNSSEISTSPSEPLLISSINSHDQDVLDFLNKLKEYFLCKDNSYLSLYDL
jgi:ATP-dependent DNA helicase RecG